MQSLSTTVMDHSHTLTHHNSRIMPHSKFPSAQIHKYRIALTLLAAATNEACATGTLACDVLTICSVLTVAHLSTVTPKEA